MEDGTDPRDRHGTGRIERRREPRRDDADSNWETIALKRVSHRVRSLRAEVATPEAPDRSEPWEDAAVRVLQRHLRKLDSE